MASEFDNASRVEPAPPASGAPVADTGGSERGAAATGPSAVRRSDPEPSVVGPSDRALPATPAYQALLDRQNELLPGVSRTFALTIPQLPVPLREAVTNAYLLCRIADTVEDATVVDEDAKAALHEVFLSVLAGRRPGAEFRQAVPAALRQEAIASERQLLDEVDTVITVAQGFPRPVREALKRCLRIMCRGMSDFQRSASAEGLPNRPTLDGYCYVVAGVVGEMLTELFIWQHPPLKAQRQKLMELAVSFGQGLQMTNIIKDMWDDLARGVCWLPRDVFARHGFDLSDLDPTKPRPGSYVQGLRDLLGLARHHLERAMQFTLMMPREDRGIRRFCLWAIALAVLTLRNIQRQPQFSAGSEVKVTRRAVRLTIFTTNLLTRNDQALAALFRRFTAALPSANPADLIRQSMEMPREQAAL